MKDYKNLDLSKLRLSHQKKWDKKTVHLLIPVWGSHDDCSGGTKFAHVVLHGENSITPTGTITVQGLAESYFSLSRYGFGQTYNAIAYYKNVSDFDTTIHANVTYKVRVDGTCGGAEKALISILGAKKAFITESVEVAG